MTWNQVGTTPESESKFLGDFVKEHITPLIHMEREQTDQAELRRQFPALQSAWEHYQMLLTMIRSNNPDIEPETTKGR